MRRIISIITISMIAATLVVGCAYATNAEETKQNVFTSENRPEKPDNQVIGKITSITSDKITITLAEMKKPEGMTEPTKFDEKKSDLKDKSDDKEKPKFDESTFNMDDMFNLSNETKTYTITNANFIKRKQLEKPDKDKEDKEDKATYSDFAVGDYVTIELESATSLNAKVVRSFDRFGNMRPGFGNGRPDFDKKDNDKKDKKKIDFIRNPPKKSRGESLYFLLFILCT